MDDFTYVSGMLQCGEVPLPELAAAHGTPLYVYSQATLSRHCKALIGAFAALGYSALPCFAVKANSNLSVLKEIFSHGFGADVVSVGELERALLAGASAGRIVFSGVGKQREEIARGLEAGILCFHAESLEEIALIREVARAQGKQARLSLRINPNIDARTHPHIATGLHSTKFGITETALPEALRGLRDDPNVKLIGLGCHIGSQITELEPFRDAAREMARLAAGLIADGYALEILNLGGGLGICYNDETPPSLEAYARTLVGEVESTGLTLLVEPGRVLVGNAGGLLTRVVGTKQTVEKNFVIVDAAMNDLIRPTLYDAYHAIVPVREAAPDRLADVVGPICETGDFLGKDRWLPPVTRGDLLFIRSAGAYGSAMASQYNSRPRAAEVLVTGRKHRLVRRRERLEEIWALEAEALDCGDVSSFSISGAEDSIGPEKVIP